MAIKKSELYSSLWKSCDELRGGMDASQYKDYILTLLFVKYVSDKYEGDPLALIEVPDGGSFKDMVAAKGKADIGDRINKIIAALAEANGLKGVIDVADFNDSDKLGKGKDMVDRLTNLVSIFENESLNFSKNRAEGDDILGDAYEYLMKNFATESGKSKGQFYTPAEVSRVMAKVIEINKAKDTNQTVYDPTCGSGSLLLKAADEANADITIYGQEMDNATAALAKMNMILHGKPEATIENDNTLSNPRYKDPNNANLLKTFDFIVANPPFSTKAWSSGFDPNKDVYERFKGYGVPPAKNGDYAFLLHIIRSLKSKGKGAIILPHGVLFRGNAEADIRKNIIEKGVIKGIIGLPANLFYGTGIPACIIVIDKENAESRKGIFMIDASKGFVKDGNKNRLREQDIHKIVDVFNKQLEISKYSRMVSHKEIAEDNEYNLNIPRYIDNQEEEDIQDIEAHLLGDIPNKNIEDMQKYWEIYPTLKNTLFTKSTREKYSKLNVAQEEIKETIFNNVEFKSFSEEIESIFKLWKDKNKELLKTLKKGDKPKEVIYTLSEDILKSFEAIELIDKYDVYQHLMSYWVETMQDDVYLIASDGWIADKELIPPSIIIDKYFLKEKAAIEELESKREEISSEKEEIEEEHSGEEGVLEELKSDKGKISKKTVQDRIKAIKSKAEYAEELEILNNYFVVVEKEAKANKDIKDAQKELDKKIEEKYITLTVDEIKDIVVDDKWMTIIEKDVHSEMDRISQNLTNRINELSERYAAPLSQIEEEVEALMEKVDGHLKRMGFVW